MNPRSFDYVAPSSIEEAIEILSKNEDAKVLAGGQSLIALMKLRLASPKLIVDINRINENLAYVREESNYVAIGAMTTHDMIEQNGFLSEKFPILTDAARRIGDQQIRNKGTIGGSCCHADPAADLPTALLALNPVFVARGRNGLREINYKEFFVDTFTISLARDEILIEIRIPYIEGRYGSAYLKHSRREGDFAIVGVGTVISMDNSGLIKVARISLGSVGPTPLRATNAEDYLKGKALNEENIKEAAKMARKIADPPSDIHGSREYRLDMIEVFVRRALKLSFERVK